MPESEKKICIGIKKIEAFPEERNGESGYAVIYPDGYRSWSPKKVFEKSYIPIEQGDEITIGDVKKFIEGSTFDVKKYGNRTVVHAVLPTEFDIVESSSCVSDSNHSQERRFEICMQRIEKQVWEHLGFVLHWANHGLKRDE